MKLAPTRALLGERCLTLAAALALDAAFGEPPARLHPVVWIGRAVPPWERAACRAATPAAQLAWGAALVLGTAGAAAGASLVAARMAASLPMPARVLANAALLKPSLAARALLEAGDGVLAPLAAGNLPAARGGLRSLVSRDPATLDGALVAAAAIQSLSENASDSIVAPAAWFLAAGLPGAWAYRAVNTLDAMVGYRGRHEHLGKAAARLDDLLNLLPSRLTALAISALAIPSGRAGAALETARRDHRRTASPNAGWPMAAMAGALGVRLEKRDHYLLGGGFRPPAPRDLAEARRIVARLAAGGGLALAVVGAVCSRRRAGGAP